eukprot:scaffold59044_cov48-Phaeocystis_antarctica.AAC.1
MRSCVRPRSCISRYSARLTSSTDSSRCAELAAARDGGASGGVFGSVGGSEAAPLSFLPFFALARMALLFERNICQARVVPVSGQSRRPQALVAGARYRGQARRRLRYFGTLVHRGGKTGLPVPRTTWF